MMNCILSYEYVYACVYYVNKYVYLVWIWTLKKNIPIIPPSIISCGRTVYKTLQNVWDTIILHRLLIDNTNLMETY